MKKFGLRKKDARYFLPPYEWYNKKIADWTRAENLQLVNFTPGTRSNADYTYPEMGKSYRNSAEIYNSITSYAAGSPEGLNGFILLIHIGTDPRRKDKFYTNLAGLLNTLIKQGYEFVRIDKLLEVGI